MCISIRVDDHMRRECARVLENFVWTLYVPEGFKPDQSLGENNRSEVVIQALLESRLPVGRCA